MKKRVINRREEIRYEVFLLLQITIFLFSIFLIFSFIFLIVVVVLKWFVYLESAVPDLSVHRLRDRLHRDKLN